MRLARVATGRQIVVMFHGRYHGHFDENLVVQVDGQAAFEEGGPPKEALGRVRLVHFNDPDAIREALAPRDVAVVLTEPAMTNNVGLIQPVAGYHEALREATAETGTLLAYDETHTLVSGPGGLVRQWNLQPDLISVGKSIAGGIPMGAYGMTDALAHTMEAGRGPTGVATGGTLFANPLSMAAARAALGEVLIDGAYERTAAMGAVWRTVCRPRCSGWGSLERAPDVRAVRESRTRRISPGTRWRPSGSRTRRSPRSGACTWRTVASGRPSPAPVRPFRSPRSAEDVDGYLAVVDQLLDEVLSADRRRPAEAPATGRRPPAPD